MPAKILVIDDDLILSELVSYVLKAEGFIPVVANDGKDGIAKFAAEKPDLVVLDVTMPKMDGFQVCEHIRKSADTPIIMLTAQGNEELMVRGLDLGADDYVVKPFQIKPFMARVRANLRRAGAPLVAPDKVTYRDEYMVIDVENHRVLINNEPVKLTPTEFKLLAILVKNKGRIIEFRTLLEQVWGFEYIDDIDYLRVYIWHLRRKIERDPKNPIYLLNELNVGYFFDPQHQ
jgi:two-component system KDP operon response regulator KdpE